MAQQNDPAVLDTSSNEFIKQMHHWSELKAIHQWPVRQFGTRSQDEIRQLYHRYMLGHLPGGPIHRFFQRLNRNASAEIAIAMYLGIPRWTANRHLELAIVAPNVKDKDLVRIRACGTGKESPDYYEVNPQRLGEMDFVAWVLVTRGRNRNKATIEGWLSVGEATKAGKIETNPRFTTGKCLYVPRAALRKPSDLRVALGLPGAAPPPVQAQSTLF